MEEAIDLDFDEYDDFEAARMSIIDHSGPSNQIDEKLNEDETSSGTRIKYARRSSSKESHLCRSTSKSSLPEHQSRLRQDNSYVPVSERRVLGARRFGIEPRPEELSITEDELVELYKSMGINPHDPNVRFHSVLVHGVLGLTAFQVHKMFAEFSPTAVDMIDDQSCNVIWNERYTVGKMILEMTKPLKRVRGHRETEEGEVDENSSDEEDGEMKEEQGDDVVINIKGTSEVTPKFKSTTSDYVEVNIDKVHLPPGKWRVLTKHVAQDQFIILRLSLRADLRKGKIGLPRLTRVDMEGSTDKDGFTYKWTNKKDRIRPGLNIFDAKGNELEWDYEHDTRFYTELEEGTSSVKDGEGDDSVRSNEVVEALLGKRKIKSRGRGAKKAKNLNELLSGKGSMAADRMELNEKKSREESHLSYETESTFDENPESDISDDLDPSPTPQPWNYKKVHPRFKIATTSRKERKRKS